MAASEALRPYADRLARLLADARGAEVLGELQKLAVRRDDRDDRDGVSAPTAAGELIGGIWQVERTADGVALRRAGVDPEDGQPCHWADVDYGPPPAGARRVVVIGESVGRGGPYAPVFSPTDALTRQLERMAPGRYQCVDLARSAADVQILTRLGGQLPLVEPDVVVVIAGNNWAAMDVAGLDGAGDAGLSDAMAESLRAGGYAAMRRTFIQRAVLPRARRFLDGLLALHTARGTQIVIVVPEFNLLGWVPPEEVEVPVLAPGALARWYELWAAAEQAAEGADWPRVWAVAEQMRELDGGTSSVPGQLLARAGMAAGDGAAARAGLEASRDALAALGLPWCTPRIIAEVTSLLTGFAHDNGFPCVDLRTVLAGGDGLGLPDPGLFHDYCHLTDAGTELMMSAVADAIAGQAPGTTAPGPGVAPGLRAFLQLTAAVHSAYCGQPTGIVQHYLRAAVDADPQVRAFLAALLELIEGADPRWTHSAIELLAGLRPMPTAVALAQVILRRDVAHTLWALREALWDVLGQDPPPAAPRIELLANRWPTPGQAHRRSRGQRQSLGFALDRPQAGTLGLTYRMPGAPAGSAAQVSFNGTVLGTLPAATRWAPARFELPGQATRTGMNWLHIHWPVPAIDTGQQQATATAALDRQAFPDVLPVFGELFDARVTLASSHS